MQYFETFEFYMGVICFYFPIFGHQDGILTAGLIKVL